MSARFGNSVSLTQARGNLLPGNHEQYAVAYNNRGAFVWDGELVGESLFDVKARPAEQGHLLFGGEQSQASPDARMCHHSEQGAVAAADVYQVIPGVKIDRFDDAFMNQVCDFPQVPASQSQVMRISGRLRRFAAVL
jgi:hypothetical protein